MSIGKLHYFTPTKETLAIHHFIITVTLKYPDCMTSGQSEGEPAWYRVILAPEKYSICLIRVLFWRLGDKIWGRTDICHRIKQHKSPIPPCPICTNLIYQPFTCTLCCLGNSSAHLATKMLLLDLYLLPRAVSESTVYWFFSPVVPLVEVWCLKTNLAVQNVSVPLNVVHLHRVTFKLLLLPSWCMHWPILIYTPQKSGGHKW